MPDPTPPTPPTPPAPPTQETKEGTPPVPPAPTDEVAKLRSEMEARIAEVTKEAIERRHENKKLKETLAALGGAEAQEQIAQAKALAAKAIAEKKLTAASVALAREGAHNAERAAAMLDLSDVEVDPETFKLKDPNALAEKVKALKKSDGWMFASPPAGGSQPPPPAEPTPTPPRPPLTGESPIEAWRKAMAAGDTAAAHAIWVKHPEIKSLIQ